MKKYLHIYTDYSGCYYEGDNPTIGYAFSDFQNWEDHLKSLPEKHRKFLVKWVDKTLDLTKQEEV